MWWIQAEMAGASRGGTFFWLYGFQCWNPSFGTQCLSWILVWSYCVADLLALPYLKSGEHDDSGGALRVTAEVTIRPAASPFCRLLGIAAGASGRDAGTVPAVMSDATLSPSP